MKITNPAGDSFELNILGYEFPEIPDNPEDANWLLIEIRINSGESAWKAIHPCLTTDEVDQLATWLKNIRKNILPESICAFIEPNLEFQLVENEAGKQYLRIFFALEFQPAEESSDIAGMGDLWMDFDLDSLDPAALAHELRSELQKYPPRAPAS